MSDTNSDLQFKLELTQAFAFLGWVLLFMSVGFMLGLKDGRSEMSVIMPVPPTSVEKYQQDVDAAAPLEWRHGSEA